MLIGAENSPDVVRLQGFLARNAYAHQLLDPAQDQDAAKLVEQYAPDPSGPRRWRCASEGDHPGKTRTRPNWRAHSEWCRLTSAIGPMTSRSSARDLPGSRLRSMPHRRVSRSSFSIRAHSVDKPGASARIENYLGFPTGISGRALTGRAFRPGAEIRRQGDDTLRSGTARSGWETELALHPHGWPARQGRDRGRGDRGALPSP